MNNTNNQEDTRGENDENAMPHRFLALFILGFLLTLIGIIILIVATTFYGEGSANFVALIFIGPIPIVVGAGPQAGWMVLFAIVLAVLSVIMFLVMRRGTVEKKV
jgi:uncharacterized membrane protein